MKRLWIVPVIAGIFAFAADASAQGMGGGSGMGGGPQGCDPSSMGAGMGCAWPDCPGMQELIDACQPSCACDMEDMEEWCSPMSSEECEQYSECPFGEGAPGCDLSWVDQCGD
ncbi:MAG: hypothetical protein HYY17_12840 [Planctomycetes bacterium]|nr:hypothetical protein [Planctomycetota bacterium]